MTVFDLFGLAAACVAIFAAWYAHRSFKRVLEIEDAIYKRLDEEYTESDAATWKPMSANPFPWEQKHVIVAAFEKDDPENIDLLRCKCAEHGAYFQYFQKGGGMLSIVECGWIPFAWRGDDTPDRDDERFPPMLTDYLTEAPTDAKGE